MPASDSSSNGGAPSTRSERLARSRDGGPVARDGRRDATLEGLTDAVGKLRRGAAALKAENRELRAEIAGLELAAEARRGGDAPRHEFAMLAEIALPPGSGAPGAARMVVGHCLHALVTPTVLHDAELLVSELVTNSLDHGELGDGDGDSVIVSVYVSTDAFRLKIDNPGTAGVVVASNPLSDRSHAGGFGLELVQRLSARWGVHRSRNTSVWFEMARA